MPVFFTFLNTKVWWGACNQAVGPRITRPICMPLVVMTTDLMFRKMFMVWQTLCWNGFGVVLKEVMMIFVCGVF